ncbi:uncharacterized protein LOC117169709 [Belonocnema kinseyi]|uniref:uncharacterized protein LOC117169709 n=1 Tax=Belonocnema kinseyi TaxID=2817044 RepID=UPI00143CF32A|nr:uncharacterized protein LOC117169709 [Belonocnema kinseyi]
MRHLPPLPRTTRTPGGRIKLHEEEVQAGKNGGAEVRRMGLIPMLPKYYATEDLVLSVSIAFKIGESTARNIFKELADVLFRVLTPTNLQMPHEHRWAAICNDFLSEWNFPHCPGAFDGKHFEIKAPPNSGSLFHNYKEKFSIVLLAVCDANPIGQSLRRGELRLPRGTTALPGSVDRTLPIFLGDGGFPILPNMMVPYGGENLDESKRIFKYRLSTARRTIENAFGILTARWRIFRRPSDLEVNSVDMIILATICLHNFLRSKDETKIHR